MPVSVYISNTSIKAVYAKTGNKKIIIKEALRENIPEGLIINGVITNDTELSRILKNFWTENNLPSKNISLVLSGKNVLSKTIKIPPASHANILKLIKSEYSDIENIESYVFDYTVINCRNTDNTASILACAVDKDIIESHIKLFESAGIKISSINTSVNAEIKLMRHFSELSKSTYLLAVIDGNVLSPALFADGIFSFANHSRLMEERGSEEIINEIARIISSFIQFSKAQKNKFDITDVYFCGMNSYEIKMCSEISNLLGINVKILPECTEIISADSDKFKISEYVYAAGNLIRL